MRVLYIHDVVHMYVSLILYTTVLYILFISCVVLAFFKIPQRAAHTEREQQRFQQKSSSNPAAVSEGRGT